MVTSKDTRKPVAARKPRATTVVAAATLDAQAADLDTDVAHILRRYASDRLHVMVEKVASTLAALEATEPRRQVH